MPSELLHLQIEQITAAQRSVSFTSIGLSSISAVLSLPVVLVVGCRSQEPTYCLNCLHIWAISSASEVTGAGVGGNAVTTIKCALMPATTPHADIQFC